VAENDFDLAPSRVLSAEMKEAGKASQIKIYPPYGSSKQEGHTLGYFGASIWAEDVFRFLARRTARSIDLRSAKLIGVASSPKRSGPRESSYPQAQCAGRVPASPGCVCKIVIEPKDPFAIENLANIEEG